MKKYSKPSISVKYYCAENFDGGGISSCDYADCLVGGQRAYSSGVTFYTYESGGTTYYVWYYDYDESGEEVDENCITLLRYALSYLESTESGFSYDKSDLHCWHITSNLVNSTVYASA